MKVVVLTFRIESDDGESRGPNAILARMPISWLSAEPTETATITLTDNDHPEVKFDEIFERCGY